jgi:hypothetical protein
MFSKNSSLFKRVTLLFTSLVLTCALLLGLVGFAQASPIPTISILSITPGVSVTIGGSNFPPGKNFTVTMGTYGSYGVGGTVVGTYASGSGAYFTSTYAIPSGLAGLDKIAIRFDSGTGFFSYNWFYNSGSAPTPGGPTPVPGYAGYPTFSISSVASGSSVTILTQNMPVGQAFTVRMGYYGTLGVGGQVVGTTTDAGGSYSATFSIPSWLASQSMIAIRLDGPTGYYYAYNWFYNNTTAPLPTPVPGSTPLPPAPPPIYYGVPTISIQSVVRDSTVTIYAYNFPVGQTFNVLMGPYGSYGRGGTAITSVSTSTTGSNFTATYSIPASLVGSSQIAIRLETPDGYYYAYNWFYNNSTY